MKITARPSPILKCTAPISNQTGLMASDFQVIFQFVLQLETAQSKFTYAATIAARAAPIKNLPTSRAACRAGYGNNLHC